MATSAYACLGRTLLKPLSAARQNLGGSAAEFCTGRPLLCRPHPSPLRRDSSQRVVAYQLQRSERRILRPSAQVSSRLYAAAASEAPGVRSVPVQVAKELVDAGHKYVDVRTPEEFEAGHPEGAVNIPFMLKHNGGMTKNQDFIRDMKDQFDPDSELVIGCLSGKRSMLAATELVREEFTSVTDVGGGYQSWEQSGLPIEKPVRVA